MIFIPKQTLKQDLHVHGQGCSKIFQDQFVILAQNSLKSNGHYDGYNRNVSRFFVMSKPLKTKSIQQHNHFYNIISLYTSRTYHQHQPTTSIHQELTIHTPNSINMLILKHY